MILARFIEHREELTAALRVVGWTGESLDDDPVRLTRAQFEQLRVNHTPPPGYVEDPAAALFGVRLSVVDEGEVS